MINVHVQNYLYAVFIFWNLKLLIIGNLCLHISKNFWFCIHVLALAAFLVFKGKTFFSSFNIWHYDTNFNLLTISFDTNKLRMLLTFRFLFELWSLNEIWRDTVLTSGYCVVPQARYSFLPIWSAVVQRCTKWSILSVVWHHLSWNK